MEVENIFVLRVVKKAPDLVLVTWSCEEEYRAKHEDEYELVWVLVSSLPPNWLTLSKIFMIEKIVVWQTWIQFQANLLTSKVNLNKLLKLLKPQIFIYILTKSRNNNGKCLSMYWNIIDWVPIVCCKYCVSFPMRGRVITWPPEITVHINEIFLGYFHTWYIIGP